MVVVEVVGLLKTEKDPPYITFFKCSKDGIGFDITDTISKGNISR